MSGGGTLKPSIICLTLSRPCLAPCLAPCCLAPVSLPVSPLSHPCLSRPCLAPCLALVCLAPVSLPVSPLVCLAPVLPLSRSLSCPLFVSPPVSLPVSLSHPMPLMVVGTLHCSILVGTLKPSIILFCPVSPSVSPLSHSLSCPLSHALSHPLSQSLSHYLSHSLTPCPSWWWGPYIVAF